MSRHPGVVSLLRYFDYDHLPDHLQVVSQKFHVLAFDLVDALPDDHPELTSALRKLLEAKDCAVRLAAVTHEEGV